MSEFWHLSPSTTSRCWCKNRKGYFFYFLLFHFFFFFFFFLQIFNIIRNFSQVVPSLSIYLEQYKHLQIEYILSNNPQKVALKTIHFLYHHFDIHRKWQKIWVFLVFAVNIYIHHFSSPPSIFSDFTITEEMIYCGIDKIIYSNIAQLNFPIFVILIQICNIIFSTITNSLNFKFWICWDSSTNI